MRQLLAAAAFLPVLASCNWAKGKTKEAVHKTGEVVAVAGSEFADGVQKGVERAFSSQVVLSTSLKDAGLQTGKLTMSGTDSTTDNQLVVYCIFSKPFDRTVTVKALDAAGVEYGRSRQGVKAAAGDASHVEFVFDKHTDIDGRGTLSFE